MSQITIRGRIATTLLARGETVTVEHTERIDRLIAGGLVERIVRKPHRVIPAPQTAAESAASATGTAEESAAAAEETTTVVDETSPAPKRSTRKKTS
ncbi:hypothetical protein K3888_13275 [Dietzia aurantiaca]|uniref:hypothetical protein n=1 Tax=Dietzia aurantiaca TaxID=983873 RepID=UPI001E451589|nr:hypothetical protein [Dietzia aurantiaca]MCD2263671.1 hypothetical protein [Dietzia aurantiaca]